MITIKMKLLKNKKRAIYIRTRLSAIIIGLFWAFSRSIIALLETLWDCVAWYCQNSREGFKGFFCQAAKSLFQRRLSKTLNTQHLLLDFKTLNPKNRGGLFFFSSLFFFSLVVALYIN